MVKINTEEVTISYFEVQSESQTPKLLDLSIPMMQRSF